MVAGLATLHELEERGARRARRRGSATLLLERTRPLVERYGVVRDVRGLGLFWAIEFGEPGGLDDVARCSSGCSPGSSRSSSSCRSSRDHRMLIQVAGHNMNVVRAMPPLVLSEEDVDWFADALDAVVERAQRMPSAMTRFALEAARAGRAAARSRGFDARRARSAADSAITPSGAALARRTRVRSSVRRLGLGRVLGQPVSGTSIRPGAATSPSSAELVPLLGDDRVTCSTSGMSARPRSSISAGVASRPAKTPKLIADLEARRFAARRRRTRIGLGSHAVNPCPVPPASKPPAAPSGSRGPPRARRRAPGGEHGHRRGLVQICRRGG